MSENDERREIAALYRDFEADSFYDPELRAKVAEKIRRFPNADADWWIGPEAVLGVIEKWLYERGHR